MGSNPRTAALCAVLACGLATASAQEATTPSSFSPGITLGFEERVRQERWNNVDHNSASADARIQERFRTRIWADADLSPDLKLSAGLCNENRKITRPDTAVYNGREVFFETLSADYRFTRELSARLGRQNIMKGEGFIFMDGTPGDGSRSGFSDALDVTWSHGDSRLDALLIDNASRDRLPEVNRIGNPKEANLLAEWNEKALVLYYTGKAWSGSTLDAYYVYKTETDFDAWNSTRIGYQPDRRFSTLGARVAQDLGDGWSATGEFALQRGHQDAGIDPRNSAISATAKDIAAWGGYARVKKTFSAPWKPSFSATYVALSGQDPTSGKITAWDPVFSRFPKWSEYYIYALPAEKGVAYWQNLSMWELEFKCSPCKVLDLRTTYYRMAALQPAATNAGSDKDRGDVYICRADVKFTPDLKGHVVYERMIPGHFNATDDPGYFMRVEVSYLFKHRFAL